MLTTEENRRQCNKRPERTIYIGLSNILFVTLCKAGPSYALAHMRQFYYIGRTYWGTGVRIDHPVSPFTHLQLFWYLTKIPQMPIYINLYICLPWILRSIVRSERFMTTSGTFHGVARTWASCIKQCMVSGLRTLRLTCHAEWRTRPGGSRGARGRRPKNVFKRLQNFVKLFDLTSDFRSNTTSF